MKNNYNLRLTEEEIDELNAGESVYISIDGTTLELSKEVKGNEYDN